jgi:hypothetical protein
MLNGGCAKTVEMARPEGHSSNAIFEVLAKWEAVLKSIGHAANDEPKMVREARP